MSITSEEPYLPGKQPRVWIITGESSGDLYGSRVAQALQQMDSETIVQGMGGAKMEAAGVDILIDSSEMGIVGIVEVLRHIRMFRKCLQYLTKKAEELQPDVVVFIDFPGFNLRLAESLHGLPTKLIYYISPQVWAWRRGRIQKIAQLMDHMLVIFPFEKEIYKDTLLPVTFVGHPLVFRLKEKHDPEIERDSSVVLLLPGSRRSEIKRVFPVLMETAEWLHKRHPTLRFVVPLPSDDLVDLVVEQWDRQSRGNQRDDGLPIKIERQDDMTYWIQKASCGIAASGTVTMEAAILGLPLVVVYRLHPLSYLLGRLLVRVPYVTIVNLVAEQKVFEEFLQGDACADNVGPAVEAIFPEGSRRDAVEENMKEVVQKLGSHKEVCYNVARIVLDSADRSSVTNDG